MLIREVFAKFLQQQKEKLSAKSYRENESVIDLFGHCLDRYAWNNVAPAEPTYDETHDAGKTFPDVYDHAHIFPNVGEFLDYFVPRKVMAGNGFILKTCPRVIRKLLKWMREQQLLDVSNEEINEACENSLWEETLKKMEL